MAELTQELYYEHPEKSSFNAVVIQVLNENDLLKFVDSVFLEKQKDSKTKQVFGLVLNRTLCYPKGGGQPGDSGVLESITPVKKTVELITTFKIEVEAGKKLIIHLTNAPIDVGSKIVGQIDFSHRFDYMQQHLAQHIISSVLLTKMQIQTNKSHLGLQLSSVDINTTSFSYFQLALLEKECTKITSNCINIKDNNVIACCGVHFNKSSKAAPIFFNKIEQIKEGIRIYFIAGERAYSLFNKNQKLIKDSTNLTHQ